MITVDEIKMIFKKILNSGNYIMPVSNHPLNIHVGLDNDRRSTFLLICDNKPKEMLSSSTIDVRIGMREDGKWTISFSLFDQKFFDIFCDFCCDLINSSMSIKDLNLGKEFICKRYNEWQEMLRKRSNILDESILKGLLGELYFIKTYLFEIYGIKDSILAWIGPEQSKQDFIFSDIWYEIKTTTSSSDKIWISSVDQLDSPIDGNLVIIALDKTSIVDENNINLNKIVDELLIMIGDDIQLQNKFYNELHNIGYYHLDAYYDHCYQIKSMSLFKVDSRFPCIRRRNIDASIGDVKYELILSRINDYKLKG